MKKIFSIIAVLIFGFAIFSNAQPIPHPIPRGSATVTNQDARTQFMLNMYIPVASDTTLNGGIDSSGNMLLVVKSGDTSVYMRMPKPGGGKKWVKMLKSGDVGNGVVSFNNRLGSILLQSADISTALGYSPVNGSGTNMQYIGGDGSKITFPITTLTQGSHIHIGGVFPNFTISADSTGGGSPTRLGSATTTTTVIIKDTSSGSTVTIPASTPSTAGGLIAFKSVTLDRIVYPATPAELRTLSIAPSIFTRYSILNQGFDASYQFVPGATVPDDSVMSITAPGGRFLRIYDDYVEPEWWGAVGDGVTDDSHAFQRAIDFALSTYSKAAKVKTSGKVYLVKNVLIYRDSNHDGEPDFVTLTIEGPTPVHDVSLNLGAITILKQAAVDAFTLGGQKMQNVRIRNIMFQGPTTAPGSARQTVEWTDAQWLQGGIRNNTNSPEVAINIDPFSISVTGGNRYPGNAASGLPMSAYYTNSGGGGTSQLMIEGCGIRYHNVGILISANGATQNGDNIVFKDGSIVGVRSFWASCQSQTRNNRIENIYSLGGVKTMINCREYGAGFGTPPLLTESNIAGSLKYLYNLDTPYDIMSVVHTKFESFFSLGFSGQTNVTIDNCHVTMTRPDVEGSFAANSIASSTTGTLTFTSGSTLEWFDAIETAPFGLNVASVKFDGGQIRGGPIVVPSGKIMMQNVQTPNGVMNNNLVINGIDESVMRGKPVTYGTTITSTAGLTKYTITNGPVDFVQLQTEVIHLDSVTNSGYFKTTHPEKYQQLDGLATTVNAYEILPSSFSAFGYINNISNDTVFIKYIPIGTTNGGSYDIYVARFPLFQARTSGNTTSGSKIISNIQVRRGRFRVGDKIKGIGISGNSYVTATNGADTLWISQNATATTPAVSLYDAIMQMEFLDYIGSDYTAGPIFNGDLMAPPNGTKDTSAYKEVFVSSGTGGGSPTPVFKPLSYIGSGDVTGTTANNFLVMGDAAAKSIKTSSFIAADNSTSIMAVSGQIFQNSNSNMILQHTSSASIDGGFEFRDVGGTKRAQVTMNPGSGDVIMGGMTAGGYFLKLYSNGSLVASFGSGGVFNVANQTGTGKRLLYSTAGGDQANYALDPDSIADKAYARSVGGGYTIQQIRDSLGIDTTTHARSYQSTTSTAFNIDTIYFSSGSNERITIEMDVLAAKVSGGTYTCKKRCTFSLIGGVYTAGSIISFVPDEYLPDASPLSTYTVSVSLSSGKIIFPCTPESATINGQIEYRVKRLKL